VNGLENAELGPFAPPPKRGAPAGLASGDGISKSGINFGGRIPFPFGDVDVDVEPDVEGPGVPLVPAVDDVAVGDVGLRVDEGEVEIGLSTTVVGVGVGWLREVVVEEDPNRFRAARAAASRGEGSPPAVSLALSNVEELVDADESVEVVEVVDEVDATVEVDVEAWILPGVCESPGSYAGASS
jgi:hypothetical protein